MALVSGSRFLMTVQATGYGVLLFETGRLKKTLKTTVMALLTKDGLGASLVQLKPVHCTPRPFWARMTIWSVSCRHCHLKREMQRRTYRCCSCLSTYDTTGQYCQRRAYKILVRGCIALNSVPRFGSTASVQNSGTEQKTGACNFKFQRTRA
jgi:hypothetical protein